MKKAVTYYRYSSDMQTEQSIEGQRRECEEFAAKNDIKIVAEYIDRALSGKQAETRAEFMRMIDDSKLLDVDYVLVYKLDRFARNRCDSAIYKRKLRDNGVRVLSAKENITDSPEGIILEGMLEAYNEYYSAELSQKVKRGQRESVIAGKVIGQLPLGFKPEPETHKVAVDMVDAETVKYIFREFLNQKSVKATVDKLAAEGIKGKRGGTISVSSLKKMLTNRMYIGEYSMNNSDEMTKIDRIIDDETFNAVQDKLGRISGRKRSEWHNYKYTGYIKCGVCDGNYVGKRAGNPRSPYYWCKNCKKYIKESIIDATIQKAISEYLTDSNVSHIAEQVMDEYNKQVKSDDNKMFKSMLKDTEKKINNIVDSIANGIDVELVKDKLQQLKEQKSELEKKIKKAELTEFLPIDKDVIEIFLKKVRDSDDAVGLLFNSMLIDKDKTVICLNVTNNNLVPPLEQIVVGSSTNDDVGVLVAIYATIPYLILSIGKLHK